MSNLKKDLKRAKQLLGAGQYEEAFDAIKEHLDDSCPDYMILCFAGLAKSNLQEPETAKCLFEKALLLDNSAPIAWQGLFKLYETRQLEPDSRGVEVCDELSNIVTCEEKKNAARCLKRQLLFSLNRFDQLKLDLDDNVDLLVGIVQKLSEKAVLSTSEKELIEMAFSRLGDKLPAQPIAFQHFCVYQHKNNLEWRSHVEKYVGLFGNTDDFMESRLLELVCQDYFITGRINENHYSHLHEVTSDSSSCSIYALLSSLRSCDITGALDIIDKLDIVTSEGDLYIYLVAHIWEETESWEGILKIMQKLLSRERLPSDVILTATWLQIRAFFEMAKNEDALRVYNAAHPSLDTEFVVEKTKVACLSGEADFSWRDTLETIDQHRSFVVEWLLSTSESNDCSNYDITTVEKLEKDSNVSWKDLLLAAEFRSRRGQDVAALLIKAAKLNPRSSRAFFLLGRHLAGKNPAKSRSCLERAVKIRPYNLEYVQLLDKVLQQARVSPSVRLIHLKRLADHFQPSWLRKTIAELSVSTGDFDVAIRELQHLVREFPSESLNWTKLAECYVARGNLQAAVNAYDQVLSVEPESDVTVSLIQVLLRLGRNEVALEHCEKYCSVADRTSSLSAVQLFQVQAHLRIMSTTFGEERRNHLLGVILILADLIPKRCRISLVYKLAGEAIIQLTKYRERDLALFSLPSSWNVKNHLDAIKFAINLFSLALDLNRKNPLAWKDLSLALLLRARMEKAQHVAIRAVECIRKAISLSTDPVTKSGLWSYMAEAKRLCGCSSAIQQHCLVRAIQLNKANDDAWTRLAILYLSCDEYLLANVAFETALKYNPLLAEAWCGWGLKGDLVMDVADAIDLYRHSLTLKPTTVAVLKYSAHLCKTIREQKQFDPATVMIQFERLTDICESSQADSQILLSMGILAELFGHYSEAVQFLSNCETNEIHLQRVKLKDGEVVESPHNSLIPLSRLSKTNTEDMFELLMEKCPVYADLFNSIKKVEVGKLQDILKQFAKSISMPLVVSALIRFKMVLTDDAVAALHEVLPRHELIDVFPTIVPDGLDNELNYLERDGEEPFRFRHKIAKPLFDELSKQRNSLHN